MFKAVRIEATGGPEVMNLADIEVDAPEPGMVTLENRGYGS
jgi:NADPH2:quinone reductase